MLAAALASIAFLAGRGRAGSWPVSFAAGSPDGGGGSGLLLPLAGVCVVCALGLLRGRDRPDPPATRRRDGSGVAGALRLDIRRALLSLPALPVQLATSLLVVASYVAVYLLGAAALDIATPAAVLLPLVAPVLLAMLLPLTLAGWGAREGAAALIWTAAGLPASEGVAISITYGLLVLVSSLPGLPILLGTLIRPATSTTP
jgi:hypothetical protein